MADSSTIISVVAAVISAVGSTFAAIAAFRSATSASNAYKATEISEKRFALRQLTLTANEVIVETRRLESRCAELKRAYRSLFMFGGSSGGSSEILHLT